MVRAARRQREGTPVELFDLTGKVAVITGSSKGIGRAIAERMAEHGAKVVISSRKAGPCEEVVAGINARYPGAAIAVPANISSKDDLQRLMDETRAAFGKIDILVCNAARPSARSSTTTSSPTTGWSTWSPRR
jgi:NAD(P)-dependent dehydrogenase (short-subunit alcohol dehydrogenase family)